MHRTKAMLWDIEKRGLDKKRSEQTETALKNSTQNPVTESRSQYLKSCRLLAYILLARALSQIFFRP